MGLRSVAGLSALILLAGCDMHIDKDAADAGQNRNAGVETREGRVTIEAPGFNLSVTIPKEALADTNVGDDRVIYPGSAFGGAHVRGEPDGQNGQAEVRFTTSDDVGRVVAWYRDPDRRPDLKIISAERQGSIFLLNAIAHGEHKPFKLHIAPLAGGGTEIRLLAVDS